MYHATKALVGAAMLKARLMKGLSSWSAGPLRAPSGSHTEGRISQRVSGLSHDSMCGGLGLLCVEMCLVWSWFFGLFLIFFFFFTCTSVLLLFVTAGLLVC